MKVCSLSEKNNKGIDEAAKVIKNGGVVAFPTDTFYGLAADPFNEDAIGKIFRIKQRSESKAILILVSELSQLGALVREIGKVEKRLMEKFWPGPLTIVFPASDKLPESLCAGSGSIGIRFPKHKVSLELIKKAGMPITATSANLSGGGNARTAEEVSRSLGDTVDMILDGGNSEGKLPSSVVRVEDGKVILLRKGPITLEELNK